MAASPTSCRGSRMPWLARNDRCNRYSTRTRVNALFAHKYVTQAFHTLGWAAMYWTAMET